MNRFADALESRVLVLDGAMGTMLLSHLVKGVSPEVLLVDEPTLIEGVHHAYRDAGADIISTCTFQATRPKLARFDLGERVHEIAERAGLVARKVAGADGFVVGTLGPTGLMVEPLGAVPFEDAVEMFGDVVDGLLRGGVDGFLVETMIDIQEARAALIAIRDRSDLPVIAGCTFSANGRSELSATSPEACATILAALGATAIGGNCSLGPDELLPLVSRMATVTGLPVFVEPNAGLPLVRDDGTVEWPSTPDDFAAFATDALDLGISIIGGCCGSTPAHIAAVAQAVGGRERSGRPTPPERLASSRDVLDPADLDFIVIGERINPSGRPAVADGMKAGDFHLVMQDAYAQVDTGAHLLDVNASVAEADEATLLTGAVLAVSRAAAVPVMIDSPDETALERAVRAFPGRPVINSVNGCADSIERVFPIIERYGTFAVALCLDDEGLPRTADDRVRAAMRIREAAAGRGISDDRLLFDPVVLTAATRPVGPVLETIRALSAKGLRTTMGLSNVSHGLPNRTALNRTFLRLAREEGLTSAIMDPIDATAGLEPAVEEWASNVLFTGRLDDATLGIDEESTGSDERIEQHIQPDEALGKAVERGDVMAAREFTQTLIEEQEPRSIIFDILVPAIERVGQAYDRGERFLPHVLMAAEAMKAATTEIDAATSDEERRPRAHVVFATVKGDVHDIGKNICITLLESSGYAVTDLGVDVAPDDIVSAAMDARANVVALSALMTTTLPAMEESVMAIKAARPETLCAVGGAVVTRSFAFRVGADLYEKDALGFVRRLNERFALERERTPT